MSVKPFHRNRRINKAVVVVMEDLAAEEVTAAPTVAAGMAVEAVMVEEAAIMAQLPGDMVATLLPIHMRDITTPVVIMQTLRLPMPMADMITVEGVLEAPTITVLAGTVLRPMEIPTAQVSFRRNFSIINS